MVVLHFTPIPQAVGRQLLSSRLTSAVTSNAFSRVSVDRRKSINLDTSLFIKGQGLKRQGPLVLKASAEIDGAEAESTIPPPSEINKDVSSSLSVEDLPLESKLQLKLDQKIRMKLAKKIRLRRKRLVRKRQLRKKGRWPPSKMKKNKNV